MSLASIIVATALVVAATILAVARIRSQQRLDEAGKNLERSQQRLGKSLDALSDVVDSVASDNESLVLELKGWTAGAGRHRRLAHNSGYPYCGRRTRSTHLGIYHNIASIAIQPPLHVSNVLVHQGDTWQLVPPTRQGKVVPQPVSVHQSDMWAPQSDWEPSSWESAPAHEYGLIAV